MDLSIKSEISSAVAIMNFCSLLFSSPNLLLARSSCRRSVRRHKDKTFMSIYFHYLIIVGWFFTNIAISFINQIINQYSVRNQTDVITTTCPHHDSHPLGQACF